MYLSANFFAKPAYIEAFLFLLEVISFSWDGWQFFSGGKGVRL